MTAQLKVGDRVVFARTCVEMRGVMHKFPLGSTGTVMGMQGNSLAYVLADNEEQRYDLNRANKAHNNTWIITQNTLDVIGVAKEAKPQGWINFITNERRIADETEVA